MLHEFLVANRGEILARSRLKLATREVPTPTEAELKDGLPLFVDQLISILRAEKGERADGHRGVSASAALHGGELLRIGLTVGQVVHDYGSICQSVTELADERRVAITADEFQTFNRCLDDAIAQAVTEYEHQRDRAAGGPGVEHLGFLAHEMRNLLTTSMLTFEALTRGRVGVQGSTGALLGRSLRRMRVLIDRTLAEVRLGAGIQKPERVSVAELIEEIEVVATLEAKDHNIQLSVDPGPYDVAVYADHQILVSAVANLVQNAFKFTRRRGHITVSTQLKDDRVLIEVEDECGGLPPGKAEDLFLPFERSDVDHTGLGLGLTISLKGVRANGGDIYVRDLPGSGCVFTVELPRAPPLG
jgi:signal transduction histidine kinase